MQWLLDNWTFLIVLAAIAVMLLLFLKRVTEDPQELENKVRNWLLFAVIEAEKTYGSGTGALKLRYVYDKFVLRFEAASKLITFDQFSKLVDEALKEMRHLLETNKDLEYYVTGSERFFRG